jgi:antirestriction protein ArdC
VQMSPFEAFRNEASNCATLAHVMTHSSRLDLDFGCKHFGNEGYAITEHGVRLS